MPSSYTSSLRLTLPVQGELSGSWGNTVNTGITQLVDTAVAGTANITMTAADYTLTNNNGATDEARAMFLVLGGTPGAARNVICPAVSKLYFVTNNTGYAQTVKTASGTGISVPNGASMVLRCDGTNVVEALNAFGNISYTGTLTGSTGILNIGSGQIYKDASGNLGVGTSSPAQRLDVTGAVNSVQARFGNVAGRGLEIGTSIISGTNDAGSVLNAKGATSGTMIFQTDSTERARITSGGNLLVGTTADAGSDTKLTVKNTTAAGATGYLWNASTSGDSIFLSFGTEATITTRGSIDYNRAGGLVRYNTTSDYRAKDIIGPVQNPGATIDALKVYEGKMKGATQSRPMLVAHEAQAVAPYAVTGEKDAVNEDGAPIYQQMDVSSLVPLLLAEIQSLRARVAALEAK